MYICISKGDKPPFTPIMTKQDRIQDNYTVGQMMDAKKLPIVYHNSPLKEQYNELLYLATFFRWSAGKPYNASGSRSPIDGKPYTNANGPHKVYEAGQKAMAKEYLRQAAIIRKTLIDLL